MRLPGRYGVRVSGAVAQWIPGLAVAREYQKSWLRNDVVAGLVLTALLIPAGMGYAAAAGLPVETGLYATIVPLLAYAVFGPSRILVLGPDSSLAPIIAAAILPLAVAQSERAVALGGLLALMVGVILIVGGLLKLGFVTDLLSKPIRIGYLNGIALAVVIGQMPKLMGFSVEGRRASRNSRARPGDRRRPRRRDALLMGAVSCCHLVTECYTAGSPGVLVAVVGPVSATARTGVGGPLPVAAPSRGLAAPALSGHQWSDVAALGRTALGSRSSRSQTQGCCRGPSRRARRTGEWQPGDVRDRCRERRGRIVRRVPDLRGVSRTPVAEQAGAKTQLCSVGVRRRSSCSSSSRPSVTAYLPSATLAAVVIVAASSLFDGPRWSACGG